MILAIVWWLLVAQVTLAVAGQAKATQSNGGSQNGSPVPGVSGQVWQHLNSETDKGKDRDDLAKMIRLWIMVVGGSLGPAERKELGFLANRMGSRQFGADQELYTSMMAGLLLKFDERWQVESSTSANMRQQIVDLQTRSQAQAAQIQALRTQLDNLQLEADKPHEAILGQIKELRWQLEQLKNQMPKPPPKLTIKK